MSPITLLAQINQYLGASTSFAGGATTIVPSTGSNLTAYQLADFVKLGGSWSVTGGILSPANMDANGYPTGGTFTKVIQLPMQFRRPGAYTMFWTGGGPNTVMTSPLNGGTVLSGSLNGANGHYRWQPIDSSVTNNTNSITVGPSTLGASYSPITNISVVHDQDLANWQANPNAWSIPFVQALQLSGYGCIRSLGYFGTAFDGANRGTIVNWASRKNKTYHSFTSGEFRNSWWGGVAALASGTDFTLTPGGNYIFGTGAPVDKQIIQLQFDTTATPVKTTGATIPTANTITYTSHPFVGGEHITISANSGTLPTGLAGGQFSQTYYVLAAGITANTFQISTIPGGSALTFSTATGTFNVQQCFTLNINGTGAVDIKFTQGDQLASSYYPITSSGGAFATMVYDADLNCWCKIGGDTQDGSSGLANGMPPEVFLDLCVQVGAHPWLVSTFFMLDPMTDWHANMVAYLRANAPPWMIPRFEGVNEQWNTGFPAFMGTRYAWNKAWVHWGTSFDQNGWQGKIISTMGQAILNAYGDVAPQTSKYWIVNGSQTATGWDDNHSNVASGNNNERMVSSRYTGQAAAPQTGYLKTAAYKYTTHTCITNYYQPQQYRTLAELQAALSYWGPNLTNPSAQQALTDAYVQTCVGVQNISGTGILTIASPGTLNWPSHNMVNNNRVALYTNGTLPTGLNPYVVYFVIVVDPNTLKLATDASGTAINFTGSQSGIHTAIQLTSNRETVPWVIGQFDAIRTWLNGVTSNDAGNKSVICCYEGGWSPDATDSQDAFSVITSTTVGAYPAKITIGSGNTVNTFGTTLTGLAATVGSAISPTGIVGTVELNVVTFSPTWTGGGSANISGASLILNQAVAFQLTDHTSQFRLPPEIIEGVPYWVVSAGNPFQISTAKGGSPITFATARSSFAAQALPGWFVTAVSGNDISLDVDATTFTSYTSGGTATYTGSLRQVIGFKGRARLTPALQGMNYGGSGTGVTNLPPLLNYIRDTNGGVFPAKLSFDGFGGVWPIWQDTIFDARPATGEWPAFRNYSLGL